MLAAQLGGIIFISAILRGLTGFGFAIAAVPLMSLAIEPSAAVVVIALLQMWNGIHEVPALRKEVHGGSLKGLAIGALFGAPLGVYMLAITDPNITRIVIAAIVLIAVPVLLSPRGFKIEPRFKASIPAGFASGFFSGLAAMPGPPAIVYFVASQVKASQMRASLIIFFFITAVVSVPMFYASNLISLDHVYMSLAGVPIFYVGSWVGGKMFQKTNDAMYKKISIALLLIMALGTGIKGLEAYLS